MSLSITAAVLCLWVALFPISSIAGWESSIVRPGDSADATIQKDGITLELRCKRGGGDTLSMLLIGSKLPDLPAIDDAEETIFLWIQLPDGRTSKNPVASHYFAPEQTWVGDFLVSDYVLDFFARASRMEVTTTRGTTILELDMKGSTAARQKMRTACKI